MTKSQINILIGALAAIAGVVLELLGVPGASVAGMLAGALGVRRPGDAGEVAEAKARLTELSRDLADAEHDVEYYRRLAGSPYPGPHMQIISRRVGDLSAQITHTAEPEVLR
jgi:hypothetical protein